MLRLRRACGIWAHVGPADDDRDHGGLVDGERNPSTSCTCKLAPNKRTRSAVASVAARALPLAARGRSLGAVPKTRAAQ